MFVVEAQFASPDRVGHGHPVHRSLRVDDRLGPERTTVPGVRAISNRTGRRCGSWSSRVTA